MQYLKDIEGNKVGSYVLRFLNSDLELQNWLIQNGVNEETIEILLLDPLYPIGILHNVEIKQEYRDKGYGNQIMFKVIDECYKCDKILLVVDKMEKQLEGFCLETWYGKHKFKTIGTAHDNPLMQKLI